MKKEWTGERLDASIFNESAIEHLHRYAIAASYAANMRVLDVACGTGYGSNLLAKTAASVSGVEKSETTIATAKQQYQCRNLNFTTADATSLPFNDASFDLVVSFETIEHLNEQEAMLDEIKRVLKPGGILLISTPDKKNYSDVTGYQNPFHTKELTEKEFSNLLKSRFASVSMVYQQLVLSSLALSKGASTVPIYSGNYERVAEEEGLHHYYLIALASDKEIALTSSVFLGDAVLQTALEIKEREIHATWSYRIGHGLLSPLKWLRALITGKKKNP